METPDEIKEGLESCVDYYANGCVEQFCDDCPYSENECFQLEKDALAYIQKLESLLAQVERERGAAVNDLNEASSCRACAYGDIFDNCKVDGKCARCTFLGCPCQSCIYKWRGVCEENTKCDADA